MQSGSNGERRSEPDEQYQESPDPSRASSTTVSRTNRTGLGRSGPRSRSGCVTCKHRRVRCDEVHPVCGHCTRLQLVCQYKSSSFAQRWRQQSQPHDGQDAPAPAPATAQRHASNSPALSGSAQLALARYNRQKPQQNALPETPSAAFAPYHSRSGYATPSSNQYNLLLSGVQQRRFDFNGIFSDLNASWAGETLCMLPDPQEPPGIDSSFPLVSISGVESQFESFGGLMDIDDTATLHPQEEPMQAPRLVRPTQRRPTIETLASTPPEGVVQDNGHPSLSYHDSARLIQLFRKIVQPPAAILIGGFERWRRLQHYLCQLSDHSRAVRSSLLCVIELLMMDDDVAREQEPDRKACMKRILERHAAACDEIRSKISKHNDLKPKTKEHLLAAIFLLSWFEVIRDQDAHSDLFPRHLADTVITGDTAWSRYSQQLLSWLNTLDSKASHLGGEHLLSPKCLEVVSHFPTKITSALDHGETGNGRDPDDSEFAVSDLSPGEYSHHSPDEVNSHSPSLSTGQVKQVMLNTILQPALEWYLTSQSYCRRISAHDKHHRTRFTSDDEYEVITACKGLESALFELWDYRPAVISLDAEQLRAIVAPDIAKRLEEIFSVYLASFWILFVYLHRVSWWNLPHSALATRALAEVWQNMQRAYGEEVNGPLRKVIHPSLLWPLFLFGSECPDQSQRTWAIEQLEALGEAKPILQSEKVDSDTLPPFKLSSGATRNAKRAAALLRELIKEQDAKQARVDDRDLSMRMFGCYFSIV